LEKETRKMDDSLLDLGGIAGSGGYPDAAEGHDQYLYIREGQKELEKKMSKEGIFIDTGAWLAISLVDDHYHTLAERTLYRLLKSGFRLVTTNHVVGETYTFLSRVRSPEIALTFTEKLRISVALDRYFVNEDLELAAFDWLRKYADHPFSFC
jgi:predicted nucleic acid-binding protein